MQLSLLLLPSLLLLEKGCGVKHQSTDCGGNGRTSATIMAMQCSKGEDNYGLHFPGEGGGCQRMCGAGHQMGIKEVRVMHLKGMVAAVRDGKKLS
jgi:hypothetical protein